MMLRRLRNMASCFGWSFQCKSHALWPDVVEPSESIRMSVRVENDGLRIGTVYPIFRLSHPYKEKKDVFSSDTNFTDTERYALRVVDIERGKTKEIDCVWQVPSATEPTVYSFGCQIWSVPKLGERSGVSGNVRSHLFHDTGMRPYLEVVPSTKGGLLPRPRVFISYESSIREHVDWVLSLEQELLRNGIDTIIDKKDLVSPTEITFLSSRVSWGAMQ
jgi:hypothetical protein